MYLSCRKKQTFVIYFIVSMFISYFNVLMKITWLDLHGSELPACTFVYGINVLYKVQQNTKFALYTLGVFTWTRITFRKTFRNVIQNVIGIVIWTTCVYMGYKRLSNHDQELRTASDNLLLLRSPRAPIDPCAYAWLQRAFLKCTRTNHVPKQLCVYMD